MEGRRTAGEVAIDGPLRSRFEDAYHAGNGRRMPDEVYHDVMVSGCREKE